VLDDADRTARAILHSGSYMLHAQHTSSPGAEVLARWSEKVPNFSMRMTALAAALLRPQLTELPRRIARWNQIHDRIAASLARSQFAHLPQRDPREAFSATSVQFSVPGFNAGEMRQFIENAAARGLPIKWFGANAQAGFTSAPRHWQYAGAQTGLEATHRVLATLCDIRTPVSLSDDECDLIGAIVREALATVASAGSGAAKPGGAPMRAVS
jgi:dTDP-4-amino-4,6-dideoxygalactose transaminase